MTTKSSDVWDDLDAMFDPDCNDTIQDAIKRGRALEAEVVELRRALTFLHGCTDCNECHIVAQEALKGQEVRDARTEVRVTRST